jgi:hypothetical protein
MVIRAYTALFARQPGTRVGDDLLEAGKIERRGHERSDQIGRRMCY